MSKAIDMRERITERAAYARMLADDGAYFMAAAVIRKLGNDLQEHAEAKRNELEELAR